MEKIGMFGQYNNTASHRITDASEFAKYEEFNKILYDFSRRSHVFLGQSFAAISVFDLFNNKVEWFRILSPDIPPEVVAHLISIGKIHPHELHYSYVDPSKTTCSLDSYVKLLSKLTGISISIDPRNYYGQGEAGRALTEEQADYIRDTFGYKI